MAPSCSYSRIYQDPENNNQDKVFSCEERPLPNSQFCLFHTVDGNVPPEEFSQRLTDKILSSLKERKSIFFIGYIFPYRFYLKCLPKGPKSTLLIGTGPKYFETDFGIYMPHMEPEEHLPHLPFPIYFNYSKFKNGLEITNFHLIGTYFNNVNFEGNVTISANLIHRAVFEAAFFNGFVNMSLTRVLNANFSSCHFKENARFTGAILYRSNFSGAEFQKSANFAGMTLYKKSDFSNMTFNDSAFFF